MSLSIQEITRLVNRYIGVSGGYLGDFSYRTHTEFYPEYCNLDIDPYQYEGTTRDRFIAILKASSPDIQAKIIQGVLQRFPLETEQKPVTRTLDLYIEMRDLSKRLEEVTHINSPVLRITSAVVEQAIKDVEVLLLTQSTVSGVDRIHTVLHGYLRAVCDDESIVYGHDDSIAKVFKTLRQQHSALKNLGTRTTEIERIFQSFAQIMDVLNPIRNNASVAHPNKNLLERDEAFLVIHATRTILHYLDAKFS